MDKYLVFALEKFVAPHIVVSCFELVKEFEINAMAAVNKDYDRKANVEAQEYAESYSKDHGVRTVVIKGSVFGGS